MFSRIIQINVDFFQFDIELRRSVEPQPLDGSVAQQINKLAENQDQFVGEDYYFDALSEQI